MSRKYYKNHSDVYGDHAMCCRSGGERNTRHNNLGDALFDTAVAAGLGPVKEGRFLLPGNDRRPADVLIRNWAGGKEAAPDATVVTPIQDNTMPGGWHPDAKKEVKKLGAALARHTGQEEGEAVSQSRLSILLQRGIAAILGNRNPALPGAQIDGII